MADIELAIKISEDDYNFIKRQVADGITNPLKMIIANGILIPKGHGRLKDMGNLQYVFDLTREDPIYSGKDIERAIKSMKTIIEADKAESEECISRQGEWLHPYRSDIACECSFCHIQMPITNDFHYCPNCGAKMQESEET